MYLVAFFVVFYVGIILLGVFVMFYADVSAKGWKGYFSRLFRKQLPTAIKKLIHRLAGERVYNSLMGCVDYVINQRNPILQVQYILCIFRMHRLTIHVLPAARLSSYY